MYDYVLCFDWHISRRTLRGRRISGRVRIPSFCHLQLIGMRDRLHVTKKSLLALGFPLLILGGIYSGIFTPTEAAAMSVIYAMVCEMVIYRTVKIKDLLHLAESTAVMTSAIFILIAVGQGFSWVISYFNIPKILTMAVAENITSGTGIAILISVAFWIACMFVDQIVAMIILLPILFPMASAAGLDPVYVGVLVSLQAAIGSVTPPFGSNIFVACAAFDRPYVSIVKGLPAYLLILILVTVLLILFPDMAMVYKIF